MEVFTQLKEYYDKIITVVTIILFCISIFYKLKSNWTSMVNTFISDAEEGYSNLTGPEKMDLVISWIKDAMPRVLTVLFNDKTLRQMSQNVYDDFKKYRDSYIKNKTGLTTEEMIKVVKSTTSTDE